MSMFLVLYLKTAKNDRYSPKILSKSICDLLKLQNTPDLEMDTFCGDPLKYKYFIEILKEINEKKILDCQGRLIRLIQRRTTVSHQRVRISRANRYTVKQLLAKRFGNTAEYIPVL